MPTATNEEIIKATPKILATAEAIKDVVLANLVSIAEVAAPTFKEEKRIQNVLFRFNECGLVNCSSDALGSGFGVLPGTEGTKNILVVANADTTSEEEDSASVEITKDTVVGPFVGDNSLALAAMASVPVLLDKLQIRLKANVIFMAATRMLGHGNLEGLRNFLANSTQPINYGLCFEGVQFGRLNYACLGMLLGDISVQVPDNYDWVQFGSTGSIVPMNDIISRISSIPIPRRPLTSIIMGAVHGGMSYHTIASQTVLNIGVRSESAEMLGQIAQKIEDITEDVEARAGVKVKLNFFAKRAPGGLDIAHPLIRSVRAIHTALGEQSVMYPTTSALSTFIDNKIPAVCLGFTKGERKSSLGEMEEVVQIGPMSKGLAQLVLTLMAIDAGGGDVV